ncbi:MAG: hypothetical protein M1821_006729 [Bathelium mastoideum]|nr:MAG: hypothetical protein M1821_006729 [Bathelium mastoideum]
MSTSVGSDVFAVGAIFVISLLVLLLLRHYVPLRTAPAYLLTPVFLAIALPCSIILLVPIDLSSSASEGSGASRGIWLPSRVVLVAWRICYWLTFCLTWFILPLLGEYVDAGYRDVKSRLLYSVRSNGRYQLMYLTIGIVAAVYLYFEYGFHTNSPKALVMALAYAWGLTLAIYLMGHGLVALPRRLIQNADTANRLRRLQARAPKVNDKLTEAMDELDGLETQVMQLRQKRMGLSRDFQDWIEDLVETSALPESRLAGAGSSTRANVPAVVTERYLADLTRKLKRARHKKARFEVEWTYLVRDASDAQAILNSSASKRLEFDRAVGPGRSKGRFTVLTPYTRYLLHRHISPAVRRGLGGILALASVAIVWSEVTTPLWHKLSLIGLAVSPTGNVNFGGQVIAAAWICYMCLAALYTVSTAKVWGNRALVVRQTYPESAAWYSYQVAKLTVPLSYNFITLLPQHVYEATTFYTFLGRLINLTPLGKGFSRWFPLFLLLPVLAAAFNLYGRVPKVIGWSSLEEDDDGGDAGGTAGWREGRALLERDTQPAGGGSRTTHGGNTLGLASRDGSPAPGPTTNGRPLASVRARENYRDRQPLAATLPEDNAAVERGDDDGEGQSEETGFLQDFAHRVRNTIETTDRPTWMSGFGEGLQFKRPRWMGGDDEAGTGGGGGGAGRSGGSGLGRWFGGGNERGDGRVRL